MIYETSPYRAIGGTINSICAINAFDSSIDQSDGIVCGVCFVISVKVSAAVIAVSIIPCSGIGIVRYGGGLRRRYGQDSCPPPENNSAPVISAASRRE